MSFRNSNNQVIHCFEITIGIGEGVLNNHIDFGKTVSQLLATDTLKILWLYNYYLKYIQK